jgi:hypothetical protein
MEVLEKAKSAHAVWDHYVVRRRTDKKLLEEFARRRDAIAWAEENRNGWCLRAGREWMKPWMENRPMKRKEERMARFGIMEVREIREQGKTTYMVRNIRTGKDLEQFGNWKMALEWAEANQHG